MRIRDLQIGERLRDLGRVLTEMPEKALEQSRASMGDVNHAYAFGSMRARLADFAEEMRGVSRAIDREVWDAELTPAPLNDAEKRVWFRAGVASALGTAADILGDDDRLDRLEANAWTDADTDFPRVLERGPMTDEERAQAKADGAAIFEEIERGQT